MKAMTRCRFLGFVGVEVLLVTVLGTLTTGQATERVSVDSTGAQAGFKSRLPSISGDGRYVAFSSDAGNLVSGDTNACEDVFVRDRQTGVTERVSLDSGGIQGNHVSFMPSISSDGRFVAFTSYADNLVAGDTNLFNDVFVHDRQTKITECVSLEPGGSPGSGESHQASISADGRFVAFVSYADDLVPGDTSLFMDVFVRDRQSGTTARVNLDSSGAQPNGGGIWPSISGDGRYVTFTSGGDALVDGDTNGAEDVFVRDLQSGVTEVASVDSSGVLGNDDSQWSVISADGRWVVYTSAADNLVSGDTNGTYDAFLRDRHIGVTERVSLRSGGGQGNDSSSAASISANGRYVVFWSGARNLVSGDTNRAMDIFVRDRQNGVTERVTVDSAGVQGNKNSEFPAAISSDGRVVAFESIATNLVSGDTNSAADIFIHNRCLFGASATYAGDGINADTIAPVNAVVGGLWSAPLTLAHSHGTGGQLFLNIRSTTINGPNFVSPLGGRVTEVLIAGQSLGTIFAFHNGVTGDIAPQTIPSDSLLVGLPWAAQYTVVGGGFGDLSQAAFGFVGCQ